MIIILEHPVSKRPILVHLLTCDCVLEEKEIIIFAADAALAVNRNVIEQEILLHCAAPVIVLHAPLSHHITLRLILFLRLRLKRKKSNFQSIGFEIGIYGPLFVDIQC